MKAIVSAASTSGAKKIFQLEHASEIHSIQVTFTGSITALVISIEGSLDGTNFVSLASHTLTAAEISAKLSLFHIVNKLVSYVRGNITTLTGTGTVTVEYDPATSAMLQVD